MKNILKYLTVLSFIIFISGCSLHSKEKELNWHDNLESAVKIAQKEHRPILVDFTGSDWCKWCKKLNAEVFSQDDFVNYAKSNLVLVKIDFPEHIKQTPATQYYNRQLAQKFGVQGFPTIIIMDSSGKPLAVTGYQKGGAVAYVQHIKSLLM